MLTAREAEQEQEHKAELSPFEIIYQAAIDRDETRITSVLSFISIDVQNSADGTVASKLASEGRHEAVHFLITRFNASLSGIIFGYARGGYVDKANEVLKLAPPALLHVWLRQMVSGYAQGGYVSAAYEARKFVETSADRVNLLRYMAYGFARGGYVHEVNEVLKLAETTDGWLRLLGEAAYGYARGGYVDEPNELLKLLTETSANWLGLLQEMAYGYARGGYVDEPNELLKLLAETPADRLDLLSEMVEGYALSGHLKAADKVLNSVKTDADRRALSKSIVKGLNKISFSTEYVSLWTLASFSPESQPFIASESKDFQEVLTPLVPRAKKIHKVMESQKLNFNQAMGWTQPEMRIWLLQGVQLVQNKKLTAEMFLFICRYLTLGSASEMTYLSNKLFFTLCPDRFFKNAGGYNRLLTIPPVKSPSAVLDTKNPMPAFGR